MPNHVTTICTVTGPHADVAAFAERHIVDRQLSFHSIIPKPAILDDTESGSVATLGLSILTGEVVPVDWGSFRYIPAELTARAATGLLPADVRRIRAWAEAAHPKAIQEGMKCLRAIAETGHPSWYEWSIANWGTKWGAYDYAEKERSIGRFVFHFQWSFPEEIFRKLATMYPALVLAIVSFDEGWNYACEGEFNGKNDYRCDKALATDAMYERVYGHPPEREDDD